LGILEDGVEIDETAVATRTAAGFSTIGRDVRTSPVTIHDLYIASPPCQTFSAAGSGSGRKALDAVLSAVDAFRGPEDQWPTYEALTALLGDERTALVLVPLRHILTERPRYVALEQVPTVLPVWKAIGAVLEEYGYDWQAANLSAEQYGVPQTRKRAVLVASRVGPANLPMPTHSKYYSRSPERVDADVKPWVSMAEALGWTAPTPASGLRLPRWPEAEREAFTELGQERTYQAEVAEDKPWTRSRPATTIATRDLVADPGANANRFNGATKSRNDGVRVTVAEAGVLQSFPADFPWQGSKTKQYQQVGNAIPPLLAEAVLSALLELDLIMFGR